MQKVKMIRLNILIVASALIAVLLMSGSAFAISNGEPDAGRHPYVGLIVFDDAPGHPAWRCSGSLISPTVVLCAGHCTDGAVAGRVWFDEEVKLPPDGHYPNPGPDAVEVAEIHTNPGYQSPYAPGLPGFITHDVGILILSEPVYMDEYGELPTEGLVDTETDVRDTVAEILEHSYRMY